MNKTLAWLDERLLAVSGVFVALASLLAHVTGLVPANDAAAVGGAAVAAGLIGAGLARLGNEGSGAALTKGLIQVVTAAEVASATPGGIPAEWEHLSAELHAALSRLESLTTLHIRSTAAAVEQVTAVAHAQAAAAAAAAPVVHVPKKTAAKKPAEKPAAAESSTNTIGTDNVPVASTTTDGAPPAPSAG